MVGEERLGAGGDRRPWARVAVRRRRRPRRSAALLGWGPGVRWWGNSGACSLWC